jgi:hypothetical protein
LRPICFTNSGYKISRFAQFFIANIYSGKYGGREGGAGKCGNLIIIYEVLPAPT